ncbi:FkbM family methyltransferase [Lysobacter claricitrinus]|uniref:FkbM family methyltransferase n=1 Tax=Lysobacter claricitrinus TaxID=3367728 RepID=UPI0037DADAE5
MSAGMIDAAKPIMSMLDRLRNNAVLRRPLMAAVGRLLRPLRGGTGIVQRAFYDALPVPYVIAGTNEHYVVSTKDKVIGRELFLRGEFDFDKLRVALALLERESRARPTHLVDVGANVGSIVIPAVVRGAFQTATAIEPHPQNLRLLRANLALNAVDDRVRALGVAVGDVAASTLTLEESAFNSGRHSVATRGIAVEAVRLDDLDLPTHRSLLWMDIEGYEGHALRGAPRLLQAGTPVVAEFNPAFLGDQGGREAFDAALAGRTVFDLASPDAPSSIERLATEYATGYTDILAI